MAEIRPKALYKALTAKQEPLISRRADLFSVNHITAGAFCCYFFTRQKIHIIRGSRATRPFSGFANYLLNDVLFDAHLFRLSGARFSPFAVFMKPDIKLLLPYQAGNICCFRKAAVKAFIDTERKVRLVKG